MSVDEPIFGVIDIQMIKSRYSYLQWLPLKSKIKLIKHKFKQNYFCCANIILIDRKLNKITPDRIIKKVKQAYSKLHKLNIDPDKIIYGKTLKNIFLNISDITDISDKDKLLKIANSNSFDEINTSRIKDFYGIPKHFLFEAFKKACLVYNCIKSDSRTKESFKIKKLVIKDTELNFVNFSIIEIILNRVQDVCLYTEKIRDAEKLSEEILYETGAVIYLKHVSAYDKNTDYGRSRPSYIIDADTGKICFGDFVFNNVQLDINSNSDELKDVCNNINLRDIFELILKNDKLKIRYINDFYVSYLMCGKRKYKVNYLTKSQE